MLVAVFTLSANGAVAATGPTVEPAARSLLRAATDYLEKQPALSFAAQIVSDDVVPSGLKYKIRATAQFDVQRPGKLFVDYSGDRRRAKFYSDGSKFVVYDEGCTVCGGTAAATNNNDSTLATIFTKYDFTVPLLDILSNHPNNALAGKIIRGYDLGASSVNGAATRHLLFTQREIDWEIWIDTGTIPLIRALFHHLQTACRANLNIPAVAGDWRNSARSSPTYFVFTPPKASVPIKLVPVP